MKHMSTSSISSVVPAFPDLRCRTTIFNRYLADFVDCKMTSHGIGTLLMGTEPMCNYRAKIPGSQRNWKLEMLTIKETEGSNIN